MSSNHLWSVTGFLLPFFKWSLKFLLDWFTLIRWIERLVKRLDGNRVLLDSYYLFWLLVLFSMFFSLGSPTPNLGKCIIGGIVLFRLFDIVVSMIYLSFFRDESPTFPARSLILLAINYIEIILIFSTVNFIYGSNFSAIYASFNFSVDIFVPLISSPPYQSHITYPLFLLEIGVSLIIHITIIQRVLSYFSKRTH